MKNLSKESALLRAKTRVQKLKGFYYHLGIYLSVNTIIVVFKIIRNSGQFESLFNLNYSGMWLFWGVGLSIHAFSVFLLPLIKRVSYAAALERLSTQALSIKEYNVVRLRLQ